MSSHRQPEQQSESRSDSQPDRHQADDNRAFGDLFGEDVQPLRGKGANHLVSPAQLTPGVMARRKAAQLEQQLSGNFLDPASVIAQVSPHDFIDFCRPGVQHGVYKNLRQGKYEIQSRLDLHRHTVEQARQALWNFLEDCQKHGVRCALVTHGKGEGREQPARLKSCVNHWLRQFDQVLAFHSAQKQHGGVGSTYVLIKKNSQSRQKTSESLEQSRRSKGR
jgi:DNA-nicking Smr family endonuclease